MWRHIQVCLDRFRAVVNQVKREVRFWLKLVTSRFDPAVRPEF